MNEQHLVIYNNNYHEINPQNRIRDQVCQNQPFQCTKIAMYYVLALLIR